MNNTSPILNITKKMIESVIRNFKLQNTNTNIDTNTNSIPMLSPSNVFSSITNSSACDNQLISNLSSFTALDHANAAIYARQKILEKKCNELKSQGKGVEWRNYFPDGKQPYKCPSNLTCPYGTCKIVTKDECLSNSKLPYNPSTGDEYPDGSNHEKSYYLEWRQNPGEVEGNCVLGNFLFRRWCEHPQTRYQGAPGDSKDKLEWDSDKGECHFTEKYCNTHGMNWDSVNKRCYQSTADAVGEAIWGKTLTALVQGKCEFNLLRNISDRRLKDLIYKLCDNYGGEGVHLYLYTFKQEALDRYPGTKEINVGFMADELEKLYPELVITNSDGIKMIQITKEQFNNKKYWRIINTLKIEHLILENIVNTLEQVNLNSNKKCNNNNCN